MSNFIINLDECEHLILEVKGHEDQKDQVKYEAARVWVEGWKL